MSTERLLQSFRKQLLEGSNPATEMMKDYEKSWSKNYFLFDAENIEKVLFYVFRVSPGDAKASADDDDDDDDELSLVEDDEEMEVEEVEIQINDDEYDEIIYEEEDEEANGDGQDGENSSDENWIS